MNIHWKCSVTIAILTVLIYLLLVNVLERVWGPDVGKDMNNTEWFKSMEVLLFVGAIIAYNINVQLFSSCGTGLNLMNM